MFKSDKVTIGAYFVNRYFSTRLTNAQKDSFTIASDLHAIIIGGILGDVHISREGTNARLQFKQGLVHKSYIYHLFDLFSSYSNMIEPRHYEFFDKRTKKIYTTIDFHTFSLPCFNFYYDLFYVNGVKRIPLNIGELLTPSGLAYWAMDDGGKTGSGFRLNTQSFSYEENLLLIEVLKQNFDLNCSLHFHNKKNNQYRIYISAKSMPRFISLVSPYFHQSMMYKISEEIIENNN
jgi:hypothetical protein